MAGLPPDRLFRVYPEMLAAMKKAWDEVAAEESAKDADFKRASAATVEASNSSRTGSSVSSATDNRAATRVALSELPPSSKKSSSAPTR